MEIKMDNRQLLIDTLTFNVNPSVISESISNNNGKVLVQGVIQRANALNQNKRVYPKAILMREVKKYMQLVDERRSLGELDHPDSCFLESAEILTSNGWKFIKDVNNDEIVLTLNLKTNKPEYKTINKKIVNEYNGIMYKLTGKNINTTVTPNHKFVVEDRNGNLLLKTAEELYNLLDKRSHLKIPKSNLSWEIESNDNFILKGIDENKLGHNIKKDLLEKYTKDIEIPYDIWMSFIGLYLSEGHTEKTKRNKEKSNRKSYCVMITQKNPEKVKLIKELLLNFPKELEWKNKTNKFGKTTFYIYDARLFNYVYPLGSCYNKYIPTELKNQSAPLLELLLEWYHIGDDRDVYYKGYNIKNIFSTSKKLMEDFQEILLKTGGNGNIIKSICKKDYKFAGHTIKAKNKKPLYTLKFNKSNYIHIDGRFLSIKKIEIKDTVYCVSVPNETFYARDNEKCFWSGNSVINLANVSHLITELHWEGDDLVGTVEVLPTPSGNILKALFEAGVKVGISSRGLGSVRELGNGSVEVQEDFEILCWDMVSNPSTQGSFMHPVSINESVDKNLISKDKYILGKNFHRINEIIFNIFSNLNFECGDKCQLPPIKGK